MFRAIRDFSGVSLAGKVKFYIKQCRKRHALFDHTRVNCFVNDWNYLGGKKEKSYTFSASCYCNDALAIGDASNYLTVYRSKQYSTRQEAEAEMILEIVSASKQLKDTSFFTYRYHAEHNAIGDGVFCKNTDWFKGVNDAEYICSGCKTAYNILPAERICNQCGELI